MLHSKPNTIHRINLSYQKSIGSMSPVFMSMVP